MTGFLSSRAAVPLVAAAAALLGAGGTWLATRHDDGPQVRDYLLAHPEVIPEAMAKLQERETGKVIADNRAEIVTPVGSAWAGNPNGDVTVVEYLDYNCGYCRASVPIVAQLIASDPQVKVVYREMPVLSDESVTAARYGMVVAAQGGNYRKLHDAFYAGGPLSDASIDKAIVSIGFDPATVRKAIADPRIDATIKTNLGLMRQLNQNGTPSWIIGDKVISGLMTLDAMKAAVAEARTKRAP